MNYDCFIWVKASLIDYGCMQGVLLIWHVKSFFCDECVVSLGPIPQAAIVLLNGVVSPSLATTGDGLDHARVSISSVPPMEWSVHRQPRPVHSEPRAGKFQANQTFKFQSLTMLKYHNLSKFSYGRIYFQKHILLFKILHLKVI